MSWRERLEALTAQFAAKTIKIKEAIKEAVADDFDLDVTSDGRTIRAVSTSTSTLPATIEQRTMRVTVAIVDVSGSMSPYLRKIDDIICECNRKSSTANLPPGQFIVICFSDRVNAVIDMSEPLAPGRIARMDGGTSYAVAFVAAREHIEQTRDVYPDAQVTIAFMTDGQDCSHFNTPTALQELHAAMRPDDVMTTVFFAERANTAIPKTLTNTSKPALDKVPVMLLTDTLYFTSWLAGAVEKSVTNLTLELPFGRLGPGSAEQGAIGPATQHMMLNNNGETLSGTRFGHWPLVLATPNATFVEAKITAGTLSWPCKVCVKRSAQTILLNGQTLLQMLQTALRECLADTQAERQQALAQIREIIKLSDDAEVRKALTETEFTLLKRAAVGAEQLDTGGALTSQKVDQQQTFLELLSSLALNTQWSLGRTRRAARNVDKLRQRLTDGKDRVLRQMEQLQEALATLQEERIARFTPAESPKEPKIDSLVTLEPIDEPELLISLWTGPPTGESEEATKYMAFVAANMGGVRAQPLMQSPWIGLRAWAQMCELNMTSNNAANIGVPVLPLPVKDKPLTPAEQRVLVLFAPLMCGLFATAQPMIDNGHIAASQLLTTIGHVLQTVDSKEQAHEFADVLVPYAWYLVQRLDPHNAELCLKNISERNKDNASNFITSATAWLGYMYCVQRLNVAGTIDPAVAYVYLHEALRQAAKRLHNSSDERNTKKLKVFCDEVAHEWIGMFVGDVSAVAADVAAHAQDLWDTPSELAQTIETCVCSDRFERNAAAIMQQAYKILDATGSALHASDRLQGGALKSAHWLKGWGALPTPQRLAMRITDFERVRTNFAADKVLLADADRGIGRSQLSNILKECLIDAALKKPVSGMLWPKRWTIMRERDVDLLRDETGACMDFYGIDPVGPEDKEFKEIMLANIDLLMSRSYIQAWFAQGIRQVWALTPSQSIVQIVSNVVKHPMLLRDARVQYWLCKEFKCDINEFAAYQEAGKKLWKDHKRRSPTMNTILSKPGQIVDDNGTQRVVDKVVFDPQDPTTVKEVTFLDGTTMRRTKYGGQRNSVTAQLLCKQFETQHVYTRACVVVDDAHGLPPFVKTSPNDEVIIKNDVEVPGFSHVTSFVCAWDRNKWMLESLYQWSPERNAFVDAIAEGHLTFFENAA